MAQISINDKTEETELLKEYIIMEKERLDANKKTFQEDRDKYEKYKMDVWSDQSEAIRQHHSTRRMKLSDVAKDVDALNKE